MKRWKSKYFSKLENYTKGPQLVHFLLPAAERLVLIKVFDFLGKTFFKFFRGLVVFVKTYNFSSWEDVFLISGSVYKNRLAG